MGPSANTPRRAANAPWLPGSTARACIDRPGRAFFAPFPDRMGPNGERTIIGTAEARETIGALLRQGLNLTKDGDEKAAAAAVRGVVADWHGLAPYGTVIGWPP